MRALTPFLLGGLVLLAPNTGSPLGAQEPVDDPDPAAEAKAVAEATAVAESFLNALSAADTAILSALMMPQAMIYSVRGSEEGASLRAVTRETFLESLGRETEELLERMWSPTVLVQGRVAMVWTPYDFHLNGEFSHCGTDVFTLLKNTEGWQVASITYNVVRDDCPPSPLGPPGGRRRGRGR